MQIINLTPHDVVLMDGNGNETDRYQRTRDVLRLETADVGQQVRAYRQAGIRRISFGHLNWIPPKRPNALYIVSLPTALAIRREDFLVPFDEVRDDAGRIIGCRELAQVTA